MTKPDTSAGADYWPPGGHDPVIEHLTSRNLGDDGQINVERLLDDPALGRVAIVSSFGADSIVLLHYIASTRRGWPVLFLETGRHFPETLEYVQTVIRHLGLRVEFATPDPALLDEEDPDGTLWSDAPHFCCQIRKVFPLQDALSGYDTWISGRKRFQAKTRQGLPIIERDGDHLKINPLAMWTSEDVCSYMLRHDLPQHPLVSQGYPSIGCAPCTRSIEDGEDARAGRWAHVPEKTECGIHLGPDGKFRRS